MVESLNSVVDQVTDRDPRLAGKEERFARIAQELRKRYGVGDCPPARRALYRRLQVAVQTWGERAYWHLLDVMDYASRCECPDRAFCKAAAQRFSSLGYFSKR